MEHLENCADVCFCYNYTRKLHRYAISKLCSSTFFMIKQGSCKDMFFMLNKTVHSSVFHIQHQILKKAVNITQLRNLGVLPPCILYFFIPPPPGKSSSSVICLFLLCFVRLFFTLSGVSFELKINFSVIGEVGHCGPFF